MSDTPRRQAIVTGAGRGIGLAICHRFSELNIDLIMNAVNQERLESAAASLREKFRNTIQTVNGDISMAETRDRISGKLNPDSTSIVLVNNAASLLKKPLLDMDSDEFMKTLSVNVDAPLQLIRALRPEMKPGSVIINIASIGGVANVPAWHGIGGYASSKSALIKLSESLARELRGDGICVNCISPGPVATDMLDQAHDGPIDAMQPGEVADLVAWLASAQASGISGRNFPLAGAGVP